MKLWANDGETLIDCPWYTPKEMTSGFCSLLYSITHQIERELKFIEDGTHPEVHPETTQHLQDAYAFARIAHRCCSNALLSEICRPAEEVKP